MSNYVFPNVTKYKLFAFSVHEGKTLQRGHYYAFVQRGKEWFECNDESVEKNEEKDIPLKNGYLFFYRKI